MFLACVGHRFQLALEVNEVSHIKGVSLRLTLLSRADARSLPPVSFPGLQGAWGDTQETILVPTAAMTKCHKPHGPKKNQKWFLSWFWRPEV